MFAKDVLANITDMPISFEVFADDEETIIKETQAIATWDENIYIKALFVNTQGDFNGNTIQTLSDQKAKLNVTAVFIVYGSTDERYFGLFRSRDAGYYFIFCRAYCEYGD